MRGKRRDVHMQLFIFLHNNMHGTGSSQQNDAERCDCVLRVHSDCLVGSQAEANDKYRKNL
jgi:hypothetical protein